MVGLKRMPGRARSRKVRSWLCCQTERWSCCCTRTLFSTASASPFWRVLYGLHQVFTKLASQHIGEGVGGFVVELTAALIIALYLVYLKFFGEWKQALSSRGVFYSVLTGICVGAGTVTFFLLFQKGGPLS